jgi:nucleoid-associated protein YgaU
MPTPKAICIEDLKPRRGHPRFLGCVAVAGREEGLGLGPGGDVLWKGPTPPACELWVSMDECLILYRRDGAPPVTVTRAGRGLQVPPVKPVVLLAGDEIGIGARRLRVHIHGPAPAIRPPTPVAIEVSPRRAGRSARAAAAAAALGSMAAAGAVEVRDAPPKVAPPPPPPPPIEVREAPPVIAIEPEPPRATELREHVVQPGETLSSIARKTGGADTVKDIVERNGLKDASRIKVGLKLKVRMPAAQGGQKK